MRRSYSSSSIHHIHTHDAAVFHDVEVEGDEEDEEDDETHTSQKYNMLVWPPNKLKNKKPLVNFSAACLLLGPPPKSLEAISRKLSFGL